MPHGRNKKHLAKKFKRKNLKDFFWSLLLLNLFREGAHMEKIRLETKDRDRKKTERAALHHTNGSLV